MDPGLLGAADVRRLAAEFGVSPTKSLGQNFVHDANTVRRIVRIAGVAAGESVLEIGPGLGSLTLGLLETGALVTAVEIDERLAAALGGTAAVRLPAAASHLTVVTGDAMRVPLPNDPVRLVANLPYNVAVPILLRLLADVPSLTSGVVMVQAEVGERLAADPGSKIYGSPSVKAAWYGRFALAGSVPRGVFWPVPNVDSIWCGSSARLPPGTQRCGRTPSAWSTPRSCSGGRPSVSRWRRCSAAPRPQRRVLERAGVDPGLRGERLDVERFVAIARAAG